MRKPQHRGSNHAEWHDVASSFRVENLAREEFSDDSFIYLNIMMSHLFGGESLFKGSATAPSINFANATDCLHHLLLIRTEKSCRFMVDQFGKRSMAIGHDGSATRQRFNQHEAE